MTAPHRVAAIDVGTNTVLLLVAEGDARAPVAVVERATITRLGAGVDRTGRLAASAIQRTVACLESYAAIAKEHHVASVAIVCTSAARDAQNGHDFLDEAARAVGSVPRIIDGAEEAHLTFDGALTGLDAEGELLVFDVGGGSTEIIHGSVEPGGASVRAAVSLNIGSVRLTERHLHSDPPLPVELFRVRSDVDQALSAVPKYPTNELVGVAGTVTTLAAIDQGLSVYDSARVHGSYVTRSIVESLLARLAALPLSERLTVPGLDPARADVIVAGACIALAVVDWAGASGLRVSDRGVRWGLARAELSRSELSP